MTVEIVYHCDRVGCRAHCVQPDFWIEVHEHARWKGEEEYGRNAITSWYCSFDCLRAAIVTAASVAAAP